MTLLFCIPPIAYFTNLFFYKDEARRHNFHKKWKFNGNNGSRIASRGWHVYRKTVWENPKKGEPVFAEQDKSEEAMQADSHAVAWKRKTLSKLTPDVIGHVPRELSRALWFFISHGGTIKGQVASSQYFRSPIARGGLEIMIDCTFTIDAGKMAIVERLQQIIDASYTDPTESAIEPIAYIDEQNESDEDDDLEILFVNDEKDDAE